MQEKKTIEAWEREKGMMLIEVEDPSAEVTAEEFMTLCGEGFSNARGVDFNSRQDWLAQHGHELTRENMRNPDLQSRPPEN